MDLSQLTALVAGQMSVISGIRQAELDTRAAISGYGIEQIIAELFPGVDTTLLNSNKDLLNFIQQGCTRYNRALTRGELNWEWQGQGDVPTQGSPGGWLQTRGRDLVQDATTDALATGKFAYFPHIDDQGRFRVTTLSGFLWPIYPAGDVSEVEAVLQVLAVRLDGRIQYEVRRYSPGLLEVFGPMDNWTGYAVTTPKTYTQPAKDRLPIAFRVVGRDASRDPEGLAQTAMPAFRRYVKFAVLLAFIATRGGFEERLVKSDQLFQLAKDDPKHPLVAALKKIGVNQVRLMDSGGNYERLDPVVLADYRAQEEAAKSDVRDAMNLPDTAGRISGDALTEKREAYTETVTSIAGSISDALTEVHDLAAILRPADYRPSWHVGLTPRFTRDTMAEREVLLNERKAGLPESSWLSGLQSLGVTYVTDAQVKAAQAREELDTPPDART